MAAPTLASVGTVKIREPTATRTPVASRSSLLYALDCVQTVTAAEPTPAGVMVRLAPSATVDGVAVTPVVSGNAPTTPAQRELAANAASNGGSSPNVAAPNAVWIASSPDSKPPWATFAARVKADSSEIGTPVIAVRAVAKFWPASASCWRAARTSCFPPASGGLPALFSFFRSFAVAASALLSNAVSVFWAPAASRLVAAAAFDEALRTVLSQLDTPEQTDPDHDEALASATVAPALDVPTPPTPKVTVSETRTARMTRRTAERVDTMPANVAARSCGPVQRARQGGTRCAIMRNMAIPPQPFATRDETMRAFAAHLSRGKVDAFEALGIDLVLGHREGPFFWDAYDHRRFFDCHCNGGVFNLGHRHPRVVQAVVDALESPRHAVDVGNHHLVSGWKAELGRRLSATTDNRLPGVVLCPSGSEAVEVALKAASATTGRTGVVAIEGAYHGHTALAAMATDQKYREPFGLALPGFRAVPWNDLGAMDAAIDNDTAAVIVEAIPATLGMPLPSDGYLAAIGALCRDRGAIFVVDEVQTGLGRTGRMWSHTVDGAQPDVIVCGKGLGGGIYPIAATIMTPEVHRVFDDEPFAHVSSYGGSDLGCVIALTVLDCLAEPGFLDRIEAVGLHLEQELATLPCTIRRRGLFLGLAWPDERAGMLAAKACFDAGVFCVFANNDTSVLQLLPPFILGDDLVDELATTIVGALS